MESLIEGVQYLVDMISNPDHGFFVMLQAKAIIWWTKIKILALQNSWAVASAILSEIQLTSALEGFYSQIDPKIASFLKVLNVPDVINMLLNAHVTRYVLAFVR